MLGVGAPEFWTWELGQWECGGGGGGLIYLFFQWKFSTSTFVSVELPAARGCGVDSAANRELPTALGPNPFMNWNDDSQRM